MPNPAEVEAELAEGRAAAFALMTDTCKITKPGVGKGPFNETTGTYDPPAPVTVYQGPCLLQIRADVNSNVVEVTAGEREWAYQTAILSIPIFAPAGATGDPAAVRVDMTAEYLTAPDDPSLAGREFRIKATLVKTRASARRLRVTQTVG